MCSTALCEESASEMDASVKASSYAGGGSARELLGGGAYSGGFSISDCLLVSVDGADSVLDRGLNCETAC